MEEMEEREYRRRTRRRIILIAISTALLMATICTVASLAVVGKRGGDDGDGGNSKKGKAAQVSPESAVRAVCGLTRYRDACIATLTSLQGQGPNATADIRKLFGLALLGSHNDLSLMSSTTARWQVKSGHPAMQDCVELLQGAADLVRESMSLLVSSGSGVRRLISKSETDDIRTWLSAAVANQETCLDGLDGTRMKRTMEAAMVNSTQSTSNSLAIASKIITGGTGSKGNLDGVRRRLEMIRSSELALTPNVVVAQDGTGDFSTINEALESVPLKSSVPFVIYVKEGVYVENVVVEKEMWNVAIVGDGMYRSIISGSRNKVDGTSTFMSATLIVSGKGFTAKGLGIRNTAGPEKHQAVAMRSSSDESVFTDCYFQGYQDTLYGHILRQLYHGCVITGTVDFIFGDSPMVLQNCTIRPRQPLPGQTNTITAQGKRDPNENTGINIQGCTIESNEEEENVTATTYLGRPWKNYSTTVVMASRIGGVVDPRGWLEWETGTVPPDTIYYAEYRNTGPGSDVTGRVTWPGYHPTITYNDATNFAVGNFIEGMPTL